MKSHRSLLFLAMISFVLIACSPETVTAVPVEPVNAAPPTAEEEILPALVPPLQDVEFPTQSIDYPSDWPPELRFPADFALVGAETGSMPESTATGWAVKLRFAGNTGSASERLQQFLGETGWSVAEQAALDGGGWVLVFQREAGSAVAVIDIDPGSPDSSRVLISLYP
ncbi:MAG: hypothetical protein MUC85_06530 [Anaerolineales bacterium]|jgi:hypothetical protein|nr:hypothetical protein [Anaerolineales bacterium]